MIPDLKPDTRTRIEIQLRIHDSVNLVVARLLENRGFHNYDSLLVRRVEKPPMPVTLHWLTEYLREHFVFIQNGEPHRSVLHNNEGDNIIGMRLKTPKAKRTCALSPTKHAE